MKSKNLEREGGEVYPTEKIYQKRRRKSLKKIIMCNEIYSEVRN